MSLVLLNEVSIDIEEAIKQYKWLLRLARTEGWQGVKYSDDDSEEARLGLMNMFEEIWVDIFKTVHIYTNDGETFDKYMVIFPDHYAYTMSFDPYAANGVCQFFGWEPNITFTEVDEVGMVPVGYMKEVSVLDVEPGVRVKIREILVEEGMDE